MDEAARASLREHLRACMEIPRRGIPFSEAIYSLTGCKVIPFDKSRPEDRDLLKRLSVAAETARQRAARQGIVSNRPNEAGNQIEPYVLSGLNEAGLEAARPVSKSGSGKTAGYPDVEVTDARGRTIYLDCKTYSQETRDQTFRSFYLSLTSDPKITKDALHVIVGFELKVVPRGPQKTFVPQAWALWSLDASRCKSSMSSTRATEIYT